MISIQLVTYTFEYALKCESTEIIQAKRGKAAKEGKYTKEGQRHIRKLQLRVDFIVICY